MAVKLQVSKKDKIAKALATSNREKKKWSGDAKKITDKKTVTVTEEFYKKAQKELTKVTLITKNQFATRHGLNLSVAKNLLNHFAKAGLIKLTYSSGNIKCYSSVEETEAVSAE